MALVHMQREVRRKFQATIGEIREKFPAMKILLPEKGTRVTL